MKTLSEHTTEELITELQNRAIEKRKPMLIVHEDDDGEIVGNASHQASCYGLASWFVHITKDDWINNFLNN